MKEYTIKAIPTMYNGVQFRSRLEATWAAFFDLCGWDWDYEPIDFNGWIPDFVIHGGIDVYVEVKPFTKLKQFDEAIEKIIKTGIEESILLLGLSPFIKGEGMFFAGEEEGFFIGWINEYDPMEYDFELAEFNDHNERHPFFKYRYDFNNYIQGWWQRLNNKYHPYQGNCDTAPADPLPLWKQAKNITQWNKKH